MKQKPPIKRSKTRTQLGIWLSDELKARLDDIKEREGLPINRQVEHALTLWFRTRQSAEASL